MKDSYGTMSRAQTCSNEAYLLIPFLVTLIQATSGKSVHYSEHYILYSCNADKRIQLTSL